MPRPTAKELSYAHSRINDVQHELRCERSVVASFRVHTKSEIESLREEIQSLKSRQENLNTRLEWASEKSGHTKDLLLAHLSRLVAHLDPADEARFFHQLTEDHADEYRHQLMMLVKEIRNGKC